MGGALFPEGSLEQAVALNLYVDGLFLYRSRMQRSQFLMLTTLTTLASLGETMFPVKGSSEVGLADWARRYGFHIRPSKNGTKLVGSCSPDRLPESLRELSELSDSPLYADLNRLTGSSRGVPFEVLIS